MKSRTLPSSRRSSSRRVARLGRGHGRIRLGDALDELRLEDGVRQRLGRTIVDLLGEARPLGLLGFHDAHRHVGVGHPVGRLGDERAVTALEEEPHARQGPFGDLELVERRVLGAELRAERLDVAAQRAPAGIVGAGLGSDGRVEVLGRGVVRAHAAGGPARAGRPIRARRAGPASARAIRRGPRDTARGRCAGCSRCTPPPRWPPPGVHRSGCRGRRYRRGQPPSSSEYRGSVMGRSRPGRWAGRSRRRVVSASGSSVEPAAAGPRSTCAGSTRCPGRPASRSLRPVRARRAVDQDQLAGARERRRRGPARRPAVRRAGPSAGIALASRRSRSGSW